VGGWSLSGLEGSMDSSCTEGGGEGGRGGGGWGRSEGMSGLMFYISL